ncbi:ABC transporter ATP-binding protein [Amorphoplanes digitatis]|uniref:ABC-2 type transport system ATP-binding protein n=1 Tax=Actinoplanes digitatis TaxID=1868 RepID=A0A7W7HT17_9ACTN|nr:ABC transporter ATP-binding protein [Actinoplanes digitatis]MBB4760076.1 ABC-2 type transport system ATP-binding protein [Actinoplanes digitatis]GID95924.1 ABC transporter ATP-binding protein [Actinoplanes digitatis]
MPTGSEEIVVSNLTKHYKALRAVDNLSFTVHSGRVTGFLGPNGAGKTTTLRMLLGLVTPTSGTATFSGVRYGDLDEPIRHVGAVLEASSAHKGRSGINHLRMICLAAGLPRQAADEALARVGLTPAAKRKFKGYSLGMKQRLGIASALLGNPRVLILDEPANGLDPEGIRWLRDLLKALAAEGRTILVSSHLLSEMQQLADDVVIIAAGKLIRQGPVGEVLGSMAGGSQVRVRTPQPAVLAAALAAEQAAVTTLPDEALLVTGLDTAKVGHIAFTAGVELHELSGERADLEQVFLQLTAGKAGIR